MGVQSASTLPTHEQNGLRILVDVGFKHNGVLEPPSCVYASHLCTVMLRFVLNSTSDGLSLKLKSLMNQSLLAINMSLPHGVYEDVVSAIGHTPLIRLNKVTADLSGSEVWAKLERCSPGGSIKDRIGLAMILEAEEKGWLKPGGTIVEGTSGNTGIGLAMVAAQRGYKCVFTMPDKMAKEFLKEAGVKVFVNP